MSIFGTQKTSSTEEITAPVFEGYSAEVNGDILAIQESWEDHMAVIEAIHELDMAEIGLRSDLKTLQESGATAEEISQREAEFEAVTEAAVGNAWAKIKAFFTKLWGKIKAFFKSIVAQFDAIFKNSENFIKKYEGDLKRVDLTGFKFKMYDYTNIDAAKFMELDVSKEAKEMLDKAHAGLGIKSEDQVKALDGLITKIRENKSDLLDSYRGDVVGQSSLSAAQFEQHLFGLFRNGADGKGDLEEKSVNITDVVAALKNTEGKKKADEFAKKTDTEFSNIIKKLGEMEAGLAKKGVENRENYSASRNAKMIEGTRVFSSLFSAQKDIQLAVFRAWKTAYTERNSAYKHLVATALRYKPKK